MPITSPNMNLPVPIVGVDSGPQWATLLDQCLAIIDAHTHQAGSGVPITPSAININADLAFNRNNAKSLRAARFQDQGTAIPSSSPDIAELYSVGGELYWNDSAGNQVKITTAGNVNAGAGSITNLPFSGAAAFNSSTGAYVWEGGSSGSPTNAYMDNGGIILRYNASLPSPTGSFVLLQAPSSSSNPTHIFPGAQTSANHGFWTEATSGVIGYVYIDSSTLAISGTTLEVASGGITATQIASNTITAAQIASGTITTSQISSSAGILGSQLDSSAGIVGTQIASSTVGNGNLIALNSGTASVSGTANGSTITAGSLTISRTRTTRAQVYITGGSISLPQNSSGSVSLLIAGITVVTWPFSNSNLQTITIPLALPWLDTGDGLASSVTFAVHLTSSAGSITLSGGTLAVTEIYG